MVGGGRPGNCTCGCGDGCIGGDDGVRGDGGGDTSERPHGEPQGGATAVGIGVTRCGGELEKKRISRSRWPFNDVTMCVDTCNAPFSVSSRAEIDGDAARVTASMETVVGGGSLQERRRGVPLAGTAAHTRPAGSQYRHWQLLQVSESLLRDRTSRSVLEPGARAIPTAGLEGVDSDTVDISPFLDSGADSSDKWEDKGDGRVKGGV